MGFGPAIRRFESFYPRKQGPSGPKVARWKPLGLNWLNCLSNPLLLVGFPTSHDPKGEDALFWEFNDTYYLDRLVAVSQSPTQWFTRAHTFFWIDLLKFIFPFLELPWWWNGRHNWFKINDFLWSMEVRVLFKATHKWEDSSKNFGSNEMYQYAGDSLRYSPPG